MIKMSDIAFLNLIVGGVKLQSNTKVRKLYKKQKAHVYANAVLD